MHLAMSAQTRAQLDDLQRKTGSGTMTDTVKRALALLDAVTNECADGGRLYVHRTNGEQVPIIIL